MTTRAALGAIVLALASAALPLAEWYPRAALITFACAVLTATLGMAWVPHRLRPTIEPLPGHKRAA